MNYIKAAGITLSLLVSLTVKADQHWQTVDIKLQALTERVAMISGEGGNLALLTGDKNAWRGSVLIDDQFAPLSEKILAAIKAIGSDAPQLLINTHWHHDHVGGNDNMAKQGAVIIAHNNVRARMSKGQFMAAFNREVPPALANALPVVTFAEELSLHWGGEEIQVIHFARAHTDGDSIVHFKTSNVIHMGDIFFNGFYPFIDVGSGGSAEGVVAAVDAVLSLTDNNTKIIPGHGALATRADLMAYHMMLSTIVKRIKQEKAVGKTVEQMVAAKPTADFDEKWGDGFLKPDVWVKLIYNAI